MRCSQLHFVFLVPLERLHFSALLAVGLGHESSILFCFAKEQGKEYAFFNTGTSKCESRSATCEFSWVIHSIFKCKFSVHLVSFDLKMEQGAFFFSSLLPKHFPAPWKPLELWTALHQIVPDATSLSLGLLNTPRALHFVLWKFQHLGYSVSLKLLSSPLVILISTLMILSRHYTLIFLNSSPLVATLSCVHTPPFNH